MKIEIPKRLLIIKDVFSHGEKHAYFGTKLDRRLAIISFHNSIELFLRCALDRKNVSSRDLDGMNFEKKIKTFKIKSMKNEEIPYDSKIRDLNEIRNKIYHDYRIPTQEETEKFKVVTKLFLEDLTQKIFDLNFEEISLFDLDTVENPFVSGAYIEGLNQFNAGKYDKSMGHFQKAFNEQFNSIYGDSINLGYIINPNNKDPVIDEIISSIDSLEDCVKKIQTCVTDNYHLELKDWVNTVFREYTTESVNSDDAKKMKRLLEEFIAETDGDITKNCLEDRIRDYEMSKEMEKRMDFWIGVEK